MKIKCDKCGYQISAQNQKRHHNYCDGSGPRPRKNGKGRGWASGKTYEEIYGKEKAGELKSNLRRPSSFTKHTEETKKRISVKMKGNTNWKNSINKSGRGKKDISRDITTCHRGN